MPSSRTAVGWIALVAVAVAPSLPAEDDFSGGRAMEHLERLVAIGPRVSGSPGMDRQQIGRAHV